MIYIDKIRSGCLMSNKRLDSSIKDIETIDVENINKYKNNEKAFTRKRKMEFKDYVWYLILQKGRTTSMELDEYLKRKNGTYKISISKQAFSKQRLNIKPQFFIDIYKNYLIDFYTNYPEEVKTYKGYHVLGSDGSIFEIPDTKELREEYKAQKNGKDGKKAARARVSGLYDVENEFMVDAIITNCGKTEKELAQINIKETGKILDLKKCIIIFDRGYPGIELIWWLEKLGVKYIFRLSGNKYKQEINSMKTEDEWIEIELHSDRLKSIEDEEIKDELKNKKKLPIRATKVILDTGEIEYLISNIEEETIPLSEMKEAYFKRWQIEIGYDILKNKLHIENFTGKTQITIEQDFYAQIYTFNVLQDIKHEATKKVKEKNKNKDLKYEYKPNINILAGWLKNLVIAAIFANTHEERKELFNILEEKAEKNLIAINPNRKYKRNKEKIKRNKYTTNLRNNM